MQPWSNQQMAGPLSPDDTLTHTRKRWLFSAPGINIQRPASVTFRLVRKREQRLMRPDLSIMCRVQHQSTDSAKVALPPAARRQTHLGLACGKLREFQHLGPSSQPRQGRAVNGACDSARLPFLYPGSIAILIPFSTGLGRESQSLNTSNGPRVRKAAASVLH